MVKLHHNLYLLQTSKSFKSVSTVSSILGSIFSSFANNVVDVPVTTKSYLWHLRLGHVSDAKLQVLCDFLPDVSTVHSNKRLCSLSHCKTEKTYFFLLSIICLIMLLILFTVMFGDHLQNVLMTVLGISLLLLMVQLDQHGSIL